MKAERKQCFTDEVCFPRRMNKDTLIAQMLFSRISDSCISIVNWQYRGPKIDAYHNHAAGDRSNDNDHGGEDHDDDPAAELMILS